MNQTILVAGLYKGVLKKHSSEVVNLGGMVDWVNKIYSEAILSLFKTLDKSHFQGIVTSPSKAVDILLALEEYVIEEELDFKLMYLIEEVKIGTQTTDEEAYELVTNSLAKARETLEEMKKGERRFRMRVRKDRQLNKMMRITQRFIDGWYPKDRSTVAGFLQGRDYKEMSKIQKKDSSSLWRKRKSLAIDEYLLCKEMIHHLMEE